MTRSERVVWRTFSEKDFNPIAVMFGGLWYKRLPNDARGLCGSAELSLHLAQRKKLGCKPWARGLRISRAAGCKP